MIVAEVLPVSQHGDIKVELVEPSKSSLSKTTESFQVLASNEDIFHAISVGGNGLLKFYVHTTDCMYGIIFIFSKVVTALILSILSNILCIEYKLH